MGAQLYLTLIASVKKGPGSKNSPVLRSCRLEHQHVDLGGHTPAHRSYGKTKSDVVERSRCTGVSER